MQKLASLIVSIYAAAFIYTQAFFVSRLTILEGGSQLFWNHLAIFLIILLPVFWIVNRYMNSLYTRRSTRTLSALVQALALLGLVITVLYHVIPLESVYDLPAQVDQAFASDIAYAVWLIVPLLVLLI